MTRGVASPWPSPYQTLSAELISLSFLQPISVRKKAHLPRPNPQSEFFSFGILSPRPLQPQTSWGQRLISPPKRYPLPRRVLRLLVVGKSVGILLGELFLFPVEKTYYKAPHTRCYFFHPWRFTCFDHLSRVSRRPGPVAFVPPLPGLTSDVLPLPRPALPTYTRLRRSDRLSFLNLDLCLLRPLSLVRKMVFQDLGKQAGPSACPPRPPSRERLTCRILWVDAFDSTRSHLTTQKTSGVGVFSFCVTQLFSLHCTPILQGHLLSLSPKTWRRVLL